MLTRIANFFNNKHTTKAQLYDSHVCLDLDRLLAIRKVVKESMCSWFSSEKNYRRRLLVWRKSRIEGRGCWRNLVENIVRGWSLKKYGKLSMITKFKDNRLEHLISKWITSIKKISSKKHSFHGERTTINYIQIDL